MEQKRYLIAVDLQKDFVDGSLGTEEAKAIVPAAAARIRARREEGWEVIATLDTHGEDYLSTAEGQKLPVVHCVRGTEGWALDPAIAGTSADARDQHDFHLVDLAGGVAGVHGDNVFRDATSAHPLEVQILARQTREPF